MEFKIIETWINKLNNICKNCLMPAMIVLLFLHNTVVNLWINGKIETMQNVLAIVILGVFACNLLRNPIKSIIEWIGENKLIVLYFIVRFISLWLSDFEYSVIRTIFFETFLLVCISDRLIKKKSNLYIKIIICLQLIFTVLSLAVYYTKDLFGESYINYLYTVTYLEKCQNALLFANPNTAGIMAGFAIIIAIALYRDRTINRMFSLLYGMFNIIALILFGCRSAEIGVLIVFIVLLYKIVVKKSISLKNITCIALIIGAISVVPIYGIMALEGGIQSQSFTEIEAKIDSLSTGRYIIWKECAIEQKDSFLFGEGSLKLEQAERELLFSGVSWSFEKAATLGPHNGYIAMISCTGIVGYIIFMLVLLNKVKNTKNINNYLYLALIFIFVINCFENLFILNRFFTSFYMLYILEENS